MISHWRNGLCRLQSLCMSIALCFGLALAIPAVETASTVQLTKTEGTVTVTNASGRAISRLTKLQMHNGYRLKTDEKSYAWAALDGERLTKVNAASELETRKKGGVLELLIHSGSVYFDISDPLSDDEYLNICTSTMVIGVRGTSGWVDVIDQYNSMIHVLEGVVTCTTVMPVNGEVRSVSVHGGESAVVRIAPDVAGQIQGIEVQPLEKEDVSGFVLMELAEAPEHCQKILEKSGLDFRDVTVAEAAMRQAQDEAKDAEAFQAVRQELSMQPSSADTGGASSTDSDDSGWEPDARQFACDGYFSEWTNVPHFTIGYSGPERGVESKSALYLVNGVLYGHVVITRPDTDSTLSGRFLGDINISFNGRQENGMADGDWLYPVMRETNGSTAGMDAPAPYGGNTYYIYDRRYLNSGLSLGKAKTFVMAGRDEMEFEIDLVKAADCIDVDRDSLLM